MRVDPKFRRVAIAAIKEAGKVLQFYFKRGKTISFKQDRSLISDIDFKAEKKIIEALEREFPSHSILSEERGGKIRKGYTWVIDPLDGTTNYLMGVPFFCISLALLHEATPILGVVFNPYLKELYFAERDKGAYLNHQEIKINQCRNLSKATFLLEKGREVKSYLKLIKTLKKINKNIRTVRLLGSSNLSICKTVVGNADGYIGIDTPLWDRAAGSFIAKIAGSIVTNFLGENPDVIRDKNILITNKFLHKKLLKLIKS